MNAFQSVRPRGKDQPTQTPPKSKATQSRETSSFGTAKTLDRNGRRTVSLERRTKGAITVEGRSMSAATLARNQKIRKAAL